MKQVHRLGLGFAFLILTLAAVIPVRAQESGPATLATTPTDTTSISPAGSPTSPENPWGLHFFGDVRFRFMYMVQGQDYAPTYAATPSLAFIDHELNYRVRARLRRQKGLREGFPGGPGRHHGRQRRSHRPLLDPERRGHLPQRGAGPGLSFLVAGGPGPRPHPFGGQDRQPPHLYPHHLERGRDAPEGIGIQYNAAKDTQIQILYFRLQDNGPSTIEGNGADPFMADLQVQQKFHIADAQVALTAGYQYVSNTYSFETGDAGVATYMAANPALPPGAPLSVTSKGMVGNALNDDVIPEMHVVEGILNVSHTVGEEKIPVLWTLHGALNLSSFTINAITNANVAVNNPGLSDPNDLALFAGLEVGKADRAGEWAGGLQWAYIEPDAVFAAFNDPNPGTGHNNNTWFMGHVELGLEDGLTLNAMQYVDWHTDYDVFPTQPTNIFGTTSRDPMLKILIDVTAKL